jgi:isocitrate dehydrogenase
VAKIVVKNPVVDIDGDEMARVMWKFIREKLVLPYLDVELRSFDVSVERRDETGDRVTQEAIEAVAACGVGVKCATLTPDLDQVRELGLRKPLKSANTIIRNALGGTIFREAIGCKHVPKLVPHWHKPIVIARPAAGDWTEAMELPLAGSGTLRLRFEPENGEPVELAAVRTGPGMALAYSYSDDTVRDFARACFRFGLDRGFPVYFSTMNSVLHGYDGRFKDRFEEVFESEFRERFASARLEYAHRLTDDMAAGALKSEGGFVWALKHYDGGVMSDVVAQAHGSLGLMTSMLMSADGRTVETEAAHGSVSRHYRLHLEGKETSTNPLASIFAWTRGLIFRGKLDATPDVVWFAQTLERVCGDLVDSGTMTKDLAVLIGPQQPALGTMEFLQAIEAELRRRMSLVESALP